MIVFLSIFSVAMIVAGVLYPFVTKSIRDYNHCEARDDRFVRKISFIAVLVGLVLFLTSNSIAIIPTGFTGVRTTFGQIDSKTVQNGINFKIPFVQSIKKVNNKQQDITFDGQVWSETKERTAIAYDGITVTYQINPSSSAWIFANVSNYKDSLINQGIVSSSIKASSKTLSDTDATNRSIIEPAVMSSLQKSLDQKYGADIVNITKVIINNADFEDSYNQAIAEKQKAQLEAEKQAIENQRAIEKAVADAKVKETNAEAAANAKLIAAKADAEANRLLEKSLTSSVLREKWINKWNGQLPQYMSGDESSVIIGMK